MRIFRLWCFLILALWADTTFAGRLLTAYTATWCGPCQQFEQDIAHEPDITRGYDLEIIDAESDLELQRQKSVHVFPTFIITEYVDDKEIEIARKIGYRQLEFREWLKKHKAKPRH